MKQSLKQEMSNLQNEQVLGLRKQYENQILMLESIISSCESTNFDSVIEDVKSKF